MERPAPDVARIVEIELEKRLTSHGRGRSTSPAGGIQPLVNILNRATPSTENRVLTLLDDAAPDLSQEVRRHLFVFTDITKLDDRAIQLIMREVLTADLAMALKGASEEVRDKIMHNLSERAATNLLEEIELLGPVRMQQVEEARDVVIKAIRALEEAGSLVVSRGADDLVMSAFGIEGPTRGTVGRHRRPRWGRSPEPRPTHPGQHRPRRRDGCGPAARTCRPDAGPGDPGSRSPGRRAGPGAAFGAGRCRAGGRRPRQRRPGDAFGGRDRPVRGRGRARGRRLRVGRRRPRPRAGGGRQSRR